MTNKLTDFQQSLVDAADNWQIMRHRAMTGMDRDHRFSDEAKAKFLALVERAIERGPNFPYPECLHVKALELAVLRIEQLEKAWTHSWSIEVKSDGAMHRAEYWIKQAEKQK